MLCSLDTTEVVLFVQAGMPKVSFYAELRVLPKVKLDDECSGNSTESENPQSPKDKTSKRKRKSSTRKKSSVSGK